jgi:DNA-directed RNA polymerase subunit M/transcription elongation factor TFIIS
MSIINTHEIFLDAFPHCIPLPLSVYQTQTYIDQPYRLNKILLFLACARNNENYREEVDINKQHSIALTIERSCYNQSIKKVEENNVPCHWSSPDFVTTYDIFCTEKANNLNPTSLVDSDYLTEKIMEGKIDPKDIGSMPSLEMARKVDDLELIRKKNHRVKIEPDAKKYTTLYACPNEGCVDIITGKRTKKAIIKMCSTRSADEGKSVQYECAECGRRWVQA